jgi:hypothetical protein
MLYSASFYKKGSSFKSEKEFNHNCYYVPHWITNPITLVKNVYFNQKEPSTKTKARKTINYTNKKLHEL